MSNIAFVLGNGESRRGIKIADLQKHGKVYACNAVYRTETPDVLVAVDPKMMLEIAKTDYTIDTFQRSLDSLAWIEKIIILDVTLGARPNFSTGRVDQQVGTLGISKKQVPIKLNFQESIIYGLQETKWAMILMTSSLKMIFQGNVSRDEVGSVIMIGDMAGQAAKQGLVPFLYLIALISVNLAFINILPIPGLDGGHALIAIIEGIIGRRNQ